MDATPLISPSTSAPPVVADDDVELVSRARRGDLGAFEGLYRRHVAVVFGLTRRMTRDPNEAEEATQRAFVLAWEHLDDLDDPSRFRAWLCRLATNLVISDLRTRARRMVASEAELATLPAARASLEAVVDLERAIDSLPPQARRVFLLHDVEGFKHHEIAAETGLATGTSKAHLHRARTLLRRWLS